MSMDIKKILCVFGTRPEAIKMAPVILESDKWKEQFEFVTCVTAQHRSMLDQVLDVFKIKPDYDLDIMTENQSLAGLSSRIMTELDELYSKEKPDWVIVQGDTTTTCMASLVAFYHQIKVCHIEAGLRSFNEYSPFPEEKNRVITSHIASCHCVPTELNRKNLLNEGISSENVFVTGNTVVDALHYIKNKVLSDNSDEVLKNVLVTFHRRENWGDNVTSVCSAVNRLAKEYPTYNFIWPVHLNPNVKNPIFESVGNVDNVSLIEPLCYVEFTRELFKAKLILTDSGGIQEEATSIGKPVLLLRDTTERPEAIESGAVKKVGCDENAIVKEASEILNTKVAIQPSLIYGNGDASKKIFESIMSYEWKLNN